MDVKTAVQQEFERDRANMDLDGAGWHLAKYALVRLITSGTESGNNTYANALSRLRPAEVRAIMLQVKCR